MILATKVRYIWQEVGSSPGASETSQAGILSQRNYVFVPEPKPQLKHSAVTRYKLKTEPKKIYKIATLRHAKFQHICGLQEHALPKCILKTMLAVYIFRFLRLRGGVGPVVPLKEVTAATLVNTVQSETFFIKERIANGYFHQLYLAEKALLSAGALTESKQWRRATWT